MNHDLSDALGELADRVERSRPALSLDIITARARRGRRRHTALVTAAAAAVVVVVAGTAFAVLPDLRSAPPAVRPAPSVVVPTGNAFLPFGACGALADADPADPVDDRFSIETAAVPESVPAGEPLPVSAHVRTPAGSVGAVSYGGPTFVVTHDGVVVATDDLYGGYPVTVPYGDTPRSGPLFVGDLPLVVCDQAYPEVSTGSPLPAGTYQVQAFARATPLGDDPSVLTGLDEGRSLQEIIARSRASAVTALGPVSTFRIVGDAAMATSAAALPDAFDQRAPAPACGAELQKSSSAWNLQLVTLRTPSSVDAGEPVDTTAELRYQGAGRIRTQQSGTLQYWATRDGVVVGASSLETDTDDTELDLGTNSSAPLAGLGVLTACDGAALSPGTYLVYTSVIVSEATVVGHDYTTLGQDVPDLTVVGSPFVLVVR